MDNKIEIMVEKLLADIARDRPAGTSGFRPYMSVDALELQPILLDWKRLYKCVRDFTEWETNKAETIKELEINLYDAHEKIAEQILKLQVFREGEAAYVQLLKEKECTIKDLESKLSNAENELELIRTSENSRITLLEDELESWKTMHHDEHTPPNAKVKIDTMREEIDTYIKDLIIQSVRRNLKYLGERGDV